MPYSAVRRDPLAAATGWLPTRAEAATEPWKRPARGPARARDRTHPPRPSRAFLLLLCGAGSSQPCPAFPEVFEEGYSLREGPQEEPSGGRDRPALLCPLLHHLSCRG